MIPSSRNKYKIRSRERLANANLLFCNLPKYLNFGNSIQSLLTVRNTTLLYEMFSLLDAHNLGELNDSQFRSFLRSTTPLKDDHIDTIFQMLDRQGHGGISWENFYLVVAILISLKGIYRRCRYFKVP